MRTEHLIAAMAADTRQSQPVEAVLPWALALGAALSGALYLSGMGIRPDLATALTDLRVILKQTLPWLAAIASFGLVLRLSRPGAEAGGWVWLLALVPAILVVAMVLAALRLEPASWGAAMIGSSLATCLVSIPLISVPVAAGALWALRRGASTRPALSGAVAGLMSGAVGAGLYAFYCSDDSPLFYGVWYVVAVLAVAGVCALIGRRVLRW